MNKIDTKINDYLGVLGFTTTKMARVRDLITTYKKICPEEILDIFITDYIDNEQNQ
jgi:hypothetical protein